MVRKSPTVKSLFAEFGVRMFALVFGLFAALYLIFVVATYVPSEFDVTFPDGRIGPFLVFVLYFGAFWASPLRATPGQLLMGLRVAVTDFYLEQGIWPGRDSGLGVPMRADYPDGGYYELEDGGVIRIRFTVLPDLLTGTIARTPRADGDGDGVSWSCRAEGSIEQKFVPAPCRD